MFLTLWATPRSTSTAFEWMMRERGDFTCFHEPFNEAYYYGSDRHSTRDAEVDSTPGLSFASVWQTLDAAATHGSVFVKDFAYSIEHDLTDARLDCMVSTFLIRDPRRVVQGLANYWPDCTSDEVGFVALHRLFHRIADRDGTPPPVLSSADLLGTAMRLPWRPVGWFACKTFSAALARKAFQLLSRFRPAAKP